MHVPDELRTKMDPKAKKCIFVGYSLEQKGYRRYNPDTHEIRVSRDVVFDELRSWYGMPICSDIEGENDDVAVKASQQESCQLSGPGECSQTSTKVSPWSGRLRVKDGSPNVSFGSVESATKSAKGKGKVNQPKADFDVSAGHLNGDESLDEEFGVPKVKTPRVQRMEEGIGLRKSTCVKYPMQRLNYESFVAHHYAYMVKVV